MKTSFVFTVLAFFMGRGGDCFLASTHVSQRSSMSTTILPASRYGPPLSSPPPNDSSGNSNSNTTSDVGNGDDDRIRSNYLKQQQDEFRSLVQQVISASKPELLPRLLANNMPLIMELQGAAGTQIISTLLEETVEQDKKSDDNMPLYDQTLQAIETILTFAEDFVEQAKSMDDHNKHLLGKIIKAMSKKDNENLGQGVRAAGASALPKDNNQRMSREEALDLLLEAEKDNFTPGFLRHIEGECERITNAPKMTRESARLLEILRIVQTRVLEELGKEMGESAVVLGQLMGYDDEMELLGVLDAGLTVQGEEFAKEMASHTSEALDGFKRVPGGVDPDVVKRVSFIDKRLREFLGEIV